MSRYVSANYIQHKKNLRRIRNTTDSFLNKYENIIADIKSEGLEKYVKAELDSIVGEIGKARKNLGSDPIKAREISRAIGKKVGQLPRMARQARKESRIIEREKLEQERKIKIEMDEKNQKEFEEYFENIYSKIDDPIVRDFAYPHIKKIIKRYENTKITSESIDRIKDEVSKSLDDIVKQANLQASEWKNKEQKEMQKEVVKEAIQIQKEVLIETATQDNEKIQKLLGKLDKLATQQDISNLETTDLENALEQIDEESNQIVDSEESRKTAVKAIVQTLKKIGFIVDTPQLINGENGGEVLIKGTRLSGEESIFKVKKDGSLTYKFHKYDGSSCNKDINKVLPELESIYGIKLSNERVIWENPDRLSADSRPINNTNKNRK